MNYKLYVSPTQPVRISYVTGMAFFVLYKHLIVNF